MSKRPEDPVQWLSTAVMEAQAGTKQDYTYPPTYQNVADLLIKKTHTQKIAHTL